MRVTKKILAILLSIFSFSSFVFAFEIGASGNHYPNFHTEAQDILNLNYLNEDDMNYETMDTPKQIILNGLNIVEMFPIYRKLIGKPLSNKTKKNLYYDNFIDQVIDLFHIPLNSQL